MRDPTRTEAGCIGKERFASAHVAHHVAKRRRNRHGPPTQAYRCSFCGGWHLGTPIRKIERSTWGSYAR